MLYVLSILILSLSDGLSRQEEFNQQISSYELHSLTYELDLLVFVK